ncbi:hypothetical protein [Cohnella nanjingensis]|uniref:hypothetical protein n=1 Tax=Cohnella nanjingensis TaxID=1387779 RepID=UPI001C87E362|nr:hypothetical protein [Cohnella nanjingensis]
MQKINAKDQCKRSMQKINAKEYRYKNIPTAGLADRDVWRLAGLVDWGRRHYTSSVRPIGGGDRSYALLEQAYLGVQI